MIKSCRLPFLAIVTLIAAASVLPFMDIVHRVTIDALRPGLDPEDQLLMASAACDLLMFIFEDKFRFLIVVIADALPAFGVVAAFALLVLRAVMHIVDQMARDACDRGLFIILADMA